MILGLLALPLLAAVSFKEESAALRGFDAWGGIPSHIAVVNPVGRPSDDPNVLSLRGEWLFAPRTPGTHRNSSSAVAWKGYDHGTKPWADARKIRVPGCWEAQGVGEPGLGHSWKCWWDSTPNPLNHQFSGDCFYLKEVTLPAGWKGKRIWLKIGAVNSQGWFWVNDNQVAWVQEYCATRKYDVTKFVKPGEETKVVALVSNYAASKRGCFNCINTWGGILRDVEFEATPEVYIDDAWVRGDFDSRTAEVNVKVDGVGEVKGKGEGERRMSSLILRATVEGETREVDLRSSPSPFSSSSSSDFTLKLPLGDFHPWSPEHPHLYWAKIELLENGVVTMTRRERFGVRKFEVRGKEFYLNGQPFFMRGAGLHHIAPIEGVLPPDRERIRRDVAVIRAAGFNQVRFHTECRWPEFFEVADEMGLMVMPELPYYSDFPTGDFRFDPIGDAIDLWKTLRRHPSFCIYSGGNEGWYGPALSRRFYDFLKKTDPDRLVFGEDAAPNPKTNGPGVSDMVGGPRTIWPNGLYEPGRPFVCHEYLNVCVKLDARLDSRFTGAWAPLVTRETRSKWLARYGLTPEWGDRLQDAQNVLQAHWRRYGLENARADPYCDGYSYWSLQDVACPQLNPYDGKSKVAHFKEWAASQYGSVERDPFVAYAGQALFDPFFGTKSKGESPADVAVYNSPSCVLMDDESVDPVAAAEWWKACRGNPSAMWVGGTNRVHVSGESFPISFLFAHYENEPLAEARIDWAFTAEDGRTLLSGGAEIGPQALGPARRVAREVFTVPELGKACKATLSARVTGNAGGRRFEQSNGWDWWFFPKRAPRPSDDVAAADEFHAALAARYPGLRPLAAAEKAKTVIVVSGSAAEREAVARGQDVIALSKWSGKPNVALGRWWMGTQLGMVLADTPVLGRLPHQGVLNPLLFRIVKEGAELPLADVKGADCRIVGEGRDACYLYLAETPLATGGRKFTVAGLDLVSDTPEGTAILDGLLDACR